MIAVAASRGPKRNSGISLLELMIALAVIAFSIMAILSMIIHMTSLRESARENELAKEWVQRRIEEVRSQALDAITPLKGTSKTIACNPDSTTTVTLAPGTVNQFKASYTGASTGVDPSPPSPLAAMTGTILIDFSNANLYEIVCSITWKGRLGKGAYSMRSLVTK